MSDKLILSDIIDYIESLINFTQINTSKPMLRFNGAIIIANAKITI